MQVKYAFDMLLLKREPTSKEQIFHIIQKGQGLYQVHRDYLPLLQTKCKPALVAHAVAKIQDFIN